MQPSFTCLQPDELKKFIAGDMVPKRVEEIEDHISTCEACRGSLEATVGDRAWWQDLESALRSDPADGEYEYSESNESACQQLNALLGPTDDPSMLGRIGAYEIIGLLGYGGMGAVFKGLDRSLNRFVAIKMLLPHLAASGAARKRFAREAQAVASVVDDHVMAIHCVDEWQGVPYLVMTYSRGASLQKRLSEQGPLAVREILRIGMQVAKGLAAAHAQGIVHRDIKPANIFLDQNVQRVQLMDFGLARAVDDASLTRSGTLAGTPQYMSPEQARAETVDHRSDLFSLGSVLYAMCTGHAPFRAESSYSVLRLITDKEPRPIRELNPDIPEWLCEIISKLMAKQTSDRFNSSKQVAELLEACLAHVQQPTSAPLPKALVHHAAKIRSELNLIRKVILSMSHPPEMTAEATRSIAISRKRIVWDACLIFFAVFVYFQLFQTRLFAEIQDAMARPVDSIHELANIARLTTFLIPAIALLALSTLYFTKRGPAMRWPYVLPVFSILLADTTKVPPQSATGTLLTYLTIVSPILFTGLGWPILVRQQLHRLSVFVARNTH